MSLYGNDTDSFCDRREPFRKWIAQRGVAGQYEEMAVFGCVVHDPGQCLSFLGENAELIPELHGCDHAG